MFGTHAQSIYGWNAEVVRKAQFELFAEFVAAQGIPAGETVLLAGDYAAPRAAWNRALPLRAGGRDLSDHYAVWARVALPPDR